MQVLTLAQILQTQDMGEKGITKITDSILDDSFDAKTDPIAAIIINAFQNNDLDKMIHTDDMLMGMATDLNYAINQLTRAKKLIEKHID